MARFGSTARGGSGVRSGARGAAPKGGKAAGKRGRAGGVSTSSATGRERGAGKNRNLK